MKEIKSIATESQQVFVEVVERLKAATPFIQVAEVRFVDCKCSYGSTAEPVAEAVEVTVRNQEVAIEENMARSSMTLDFRAPSPFSDDDAEKKKRVHVVARMEVKYVLLADRPRGDDEAIGTFCRVNGIQTAWPYFREYLHSSLARLGLPPFDLPLLTPLKAAELAGLLRKTPGDEVVPSVAPQARPTVGR